MSDADLCMTAIELFRYYEELADNKHKHCHGCGETLGSYSLVSLDEIPKHLRQYNQTEERIAADLSRLKALVGDGKARFCDDCWYASFWDADEAERLHRLAYKLRKMTRNEFERRSGLLLRLAKKRMKADAGTWRLSRDRPLNARLRLSEVWVLNHPDFDLLEFSRSRTK